jgi:hypothetical protein
VTHLDESELLVPYVELGNNDFVWALCVGLPLSRLFVHFCVGFGPEFP